MFLLYILREIPVFMRMGLLKNWKGGKALKKDSVSPERFEARLRKVAAEPENGSRLKKVATEEEKVVTKPDKFTAEPANVNDASWKKSRPRRQKNQALGNPLPNMKNSPRGQKT